MVTSMMTAMERTTGMAGTMNMPTTPTGMPNMMMVPRCTMSFEKVADGMRISCVCDDPTSCSMVQNLCSMLAGGMCSVCCMMNGMMVCCCNLTMGLCKCEMTAKGCTVTCTSKDPDCCKMIQACCDCMSTMLKSGCTCCMMMNGTPVCCC
jgi:hypothetical protein